MPDPHHAQAATAVTVRRWRPDEPVREITALLHRAYREQVEMGLRPLAGRQDDAMTRARFSSGEAYIAVTGEGAAARIVGCILFEEHESAEFPEWFLRPDVAHFSLFAVDPDFQGCGVGARLLDTIRIRAMEMGYAELALSMAEPDEKLMRYYLKRGYRLIQHWQWPYTNYRSAILSFKLN